MPMARARARARRAIARASRRDVARDSRDRAFERAVADRPTARGQTVRRARTRARIRLASRETHTRTQRNRARGGGGGARRRRRARGAGGRDASRGSLDGASRRRIMAKTRRRKRRTHVDEDARGGSKGKDADAPRTFVFTRGRMADAVRDLSEDLRKVRARRGEARRGDASRGDRGAVRASEGTRGLTSDDDARRR